MTWAALQQHLPVAVAAAGGLYEDPEADTLVPAVYWVNQDAAWRPDAWARLEVISNTAPYPVERRFAYDSEIDKVVERMAGLRVLGVQVTVESVSQDLSKSAEAYADAIRSRLMSRTIRDALLHDGNTALTRVGNVLPGTYTSREDRRQSAAILEITLHMHTVYAAGEHDRVVDTGIRALGLPVALPYAL